MTIIERAAHLERIKSLRERASLLRNAAHHADDRASFNTDMQAANRAEAEANELEAQLPQPTVADPL